MFHWVESAEANAQQSSADSRFLNNFRVWLTTAEKRALVAKKIIELPMEGPLGG